MSYTVQEALLGQVQTKVQQWIDLRLTGFTSLVLLLISCMTLGRPCTLPKPKWLFKQMKWVEVRNNA